MLCNVVRLQPHLCGREHFVAHVWPFVIVEVNDASNDTSCILKVLWPFHVIEPFFLYNAVDSFRNGIVCRLVVFSHAYGCLNLIKAGYVSVAAVLRATVGMMRQKRKIHSCSLFYGHIKGGKRMYGLKAVGKFPANNLMGVGIGYQVKVNDTILRVYICNVSHP